MRRLTTIPLAATALCLGLCVSALAAPPAILKTSFSHVTTSSAALEAVIDPNGTDTKYHFEYGIGKCVPGPCTKAPMLEGKVPAVIIATGDVTEKEPTITNVITTAGAFGVGDEISGAGIPASTTITAVNTVAKTLTLSTVATADGTNIALTATGPQPVSTPISGLSPFTTYHLRVVVTNGAKVEGPEITLTTFSLPQAFGPCSNDVFRAGRPSGALPDCRAYEQASPIDKNGVDARGRVSWVKASPSGNAISYGAAGNLPGAEGSQELPAYLASRNGGAWSTQGLLPPPSAGQLVSVLGWTPDFSETYSEATRLGPPGDTALLGRSSSAGHSLSEVAPYGKGLIKPSFVGTSGEGAEVVFESKAKLLPAAVTGASNVYAWDRTANKLSLASALNSASPEGESPPEGAFGGSYSWIAGTSPSSLQAGGAASGYYTQDSHAISADGSVIFTAAGSGQLYMRRNPTQAQSKLDVNGNCTEPTKACTLHISASQKKNGTGENGTDAAGTQPAAFLGAAANGSSVLFTSTEKLTDDATTGPEPPPAALGQANIEDASAKDLDLCLAVAKGVAVDGSHLYWTNPKEGTIGRAGPECENPEPSFISGADNPQYVAVDAGHIYWTNAGEGKDGEGTIGRAKLGATEAEEVNEEFIKGASDPQGIAVDAEHVYWANAGDAQGSGDAEVESRTIGRAAIGGTAVEQAFIQVDHGAQQYRPQGIAVNATSIYIGIDSPREGNYIFRYDLDGNPASEILLFDANGVGLRGIALDAGHVYWARQDGDSIGRVNLNLEAASAEREFIPAAGHPQGLAADASHLYWSVNGEVPVNLGTDLYRYETATGKLSDLTVDGEASDPNGAEVKGMLGASVDGSKAYFVANGDLDGVGGPGSAGGCRGTADENSVSFTGQCNLYLAEEGQATRFIARLDASGASTTDSSDARDWLPNGGPIAQREKTARVSPDGNTVLFSSQEKLSAYDNEGVPELYRYRVGDAGPTCISCNPTGTAPSSGPSFGNIDLFAIIPGARNALVLSRNLSADGNHAFFQSTEALSGEDTNGNEGCAEEGTATYSFPSCQDVYEWEAKGTGSCTTDIQGGGCLYLLSTGKSPRASFFGDASESGEDAFLITSSPGLVRQDQDQLFDVYDAHAFGGLASQEAVAAVPCEGEACKGGAKPPAAFQSPASATFKGPGNPKPSCPKGKRKVRSKGKSRCVAKKQHKGQKQKHKHKRAAKQTGRAGR